MSAQAHVSSKIVCEGDGFKETETGVKIYHGGMTEWFFPWAAIMWVEKKSEKNTTKYTVTLYPMFR